MPDRRRYLDFALTVCREAGEILRDVRKKSAFKVESKSGFELVSEADTAIDAHFRHRIGAEFPGHAILSEESDADLEPGSAPCWIVDPVDGTANFVHGHDHVAISAALMLDGEVAVGVVHAPFTGQTFSAVRGEGAYRDGERIRASTLTDVRRALIAIGFPHVRTNIEVLVDRLKPLLAEFGDIRRLAAPTLDICWVADGRLSGFVDRIHIWDIAAAGLIATEAGARVARLGPPHREEPDGVDYIVAAPGIFDRLLTNISRSQRAG